MNDITIWQTYGEGYCHLVLLHGWGLNAEVWHCIRELGSHFTLHLVDLPGYGRSSGFNAMTLEDMTAQVAKNAPDGLSGLAGALGGTVASRVNSPTLVRPGAGDCRLFAVTARVKDWPGIKPGGGFQQQRRFFSARWAFLALQALGTETARQDAHALKAWCWRSLCRISRGAQWRTGNQNGRLREALKNVNMPFCVCMVIWTVWCRVKWCLCSIRYGRTVHHR